MTYLEAHTIKSGAELINKNNGGKYVLLSVETVSVYKSQAETVYIVRAPDGKAARWNTSHFVAAFEVVK